MTFGKYIRDHAGWLGIAGFLAVTTDIFLLTQHRATALMIYVAASVCVCVLLGMYLDYRKTKRFFNEILDSLESLDQKYLLPELIKSEETEEQRLVMYILKQMELSMADSVNEYRRRNEDYKNYIETWVHEVKVPIATAGMIIENHKNETVKETGVAGEIKRIQNYVEQALFYARSEAVEKDYFIKPVDLEDTVGTVISEKKVILREKRAILDIHDMETPTDILSDGKWLGFIIGQIVDNSIKYAKDGEAPKIEIFVSEDDGKCKLHIKDFGRGMKKAEVARAFEKGFTGTNGRNVSASTGMGLFLCKKLCDKLGHTLSIESAEGEGTELIIAF